MNQAQPALSMEIVAAITAALAAVLDQPPGSFVITGIQAQHPAFRPVAPPSGWARAGVLESHLARRQFGLRTR